MKKTFTVIELGGGVENPVELSLRPNTTHHEAARIYASKTPIAGHYWPCPSTPGGSVSLYYQVFDFGWGGLDANPYPDRGITYRAMQEVGKPNTLQVQQWDGEIPWKRSPLGYSGATWVAKGLKKPLSPLGVIVADILGDTFEGIYHLNETSLSKVDWLDPYCIRVVVADGGGYISTVDYNVLTKLVVFAHDRGVRLEILGAAHRYLRLVFTLRDSRDPQDGLHRYCPTIEEHVAKIRRQPAVPLHLTHIFTQADWDKAMEGWRGTARSMYPGIVLGDGGGEISIETIPPATPITPTTLHDHRWNLRPVSTHTPVRTYWKTIRPDWEPHSQEMCVVKVIWNDDDPHYGRFTPDGVKYTVWVDGKFAPGVTTIEQLEQLVQLFETKEQTDDETTG